MRKRTIVLLTFTILLLVSCGAAYAGIAVHYRTHFLPHTTINGRDVSDLTPQQAQERIAQDASDYLLIIRPREGEEETITSEEIGYHYVPGEEVGQLMEGQQAFAWLPSWISGEYPFHVPEITEYDPELLAKRIRSLDFLQEDAVTPVQDAHIEKQEGSYVIVPEVTGNDPDPEKVAALVRKAVDAGTTKLFLEEADCYRKPSVLAGDGALRAEAAAWNKYSSVSVTYRMGGGVEVELPAATTAEWLTLNKDLTPVFDRDAAAAWVNELADKYDTIGTWQPFRTTNQETVYPESRTYGWQMDRETETDELKALLEKGESAVRDPVWLESAASRGENDLGGTYVEIDYTNQHMWYYRDGVLILDTAVVTGNTSLGQGSPEGVFCIVNKEQNAILKGEGYETPVSYWMPFYEGVGIHDADTWRQVYGGTIYQYAGSHGCINTPTENAARIFQEIEIGTPVVCYRSEFDYGYSEFTVQPVWNAGGENGQPGDNASGDGTQSGGDSAGTADGTVTIDGADVWDGTWDDGSGTWTDDGGSGTWTDDSGSGDSGTWTDDGGLVWDDVTVIPEPQDGTQNSWEDYGVVIDGGSGWDSYDQPVG